MASTEIAVIGGGITGGSVAWQLAAHGAGHVTVYEKSVVAAEASGRTGALLRRHYTNEPEARLAQLGWEIFSNWDERVGGSCGHVPWPVIVTVATKGEYASNIELMRQNIAMQNRLGIDSRLIDAEEFQELRFHSYVGDVDYVSFESDSGYVDSVQATQSMMEAAVRSGVTFREDSEVIGILTSGGRIRRIRPPMGISRRMSWSVPRDLGRPS